MASTFASPSPFRVDIPDDEVERMKRLIRDTRLPEQPPLPGASWDYGVDLDWLKNMREAWLNDFDWKTVEAEMNTFDHYTVPIESITLHFIHQKSPRDDAIPILLLHGWPGSFWEFHRTIKLLTHPPADQPAFHVVVPSLPGFAFSSPAPRQGWKMGDNARLLDALMTGVLGYPTYFASGGDFGSLICAHLGGAQFPACKLLAISGVGVGPTLGALCTLPLFLLPARWRTWAYSWIYAEDELAALARSWSLVKNGMGYFVEQRTRPFTIGYALADSPMGLLSWIGEKYREHMDPSISGSPHSTQFVLATVSLYFLTRSFATTAVAYHEEDASFGRKLRIAKPLGALYFPFDVNNYPLAWVRARNRELVYAKKHERGGHFPGYETPELLADDLRAMATSQRRLFV